GRGGAAGREGRRPRRPPLRGDVPRLRGARRRRPRRARPRRRDRDRAGRRGELEGVLLQFVADTPGLTALKAAVGVLYSEYDRLDEARETLDAKVAEGFENHRDDAFGLAALVLWSYVIADVGHVEAARLLLPDLLPRRDQFGGAAVV